MLGPIFHLGLLEIGVDGMQKMLDLVETGPGGGLMLLHPASKIIHDILNSHLKFTLLKVDFIQDDLDRFYKRCMVQPEISVLLLHVKARIGQLVQGVDVVVVE